MHTQIPVQPEERSFEMSGLALLSALAGLRILKDILQDIFGKNQTDLTLLIDIPLLIVFILLFILAITAKVKTVPLAIGFLLVVLTTWSYITLGGVEGTSEYNFMGLAVMITLCYRKRRLIIVLTAMFAAIAMVNIAQLMHWPIGFPGRRMTSSHDSFFSTLITVGIALLYFKLLLKVETSKISYVRELLRSHWTQIRRRRDELFQQQALLLEVTRRLHDDVHSYDDDIREQNESIRDYVYLSTQNLRLSLSQMTAVPGTLSVETHLADRLNEQLLELNGVVDNLITELEKSGHGSHH